MEQSNLTSRQLYQAFKANPTRKRFGFGRKPALINIDLQKAYTCVGEFATAYETDPRQLEHVNTLAAEFRARGFPVVWTYVAYMDSGEDCGVWGTRTNTPDSLQNIKVGSRRSEFDDRLVIDHQRDIVINKRMASAFFETNLGSVFNFHGVDTVVVTGGPQPGRRRAHPANKGKPIRCAQYVFDGIAWFGSGQTQVHGQQMQIVVAQQTAGAVA